MTAAVVVNTVLCVALVWTCFCRIVRTDDNTHADVRLAFCALATVAGVCLMAPVWWGMQPQVPQLALEGAALAVQVLTARYWKYGVPTHYQKPTCNHNNNEVHP